ncbi:type VI secretion system protein [Rhodoferax sp.]|uniref:type VI secretion system protein n=1 Tax=Rhodoferax sp. TaxID=50421 RepID=UPI002747C537|nr:type VI secretion system protein [Rhodoferax sp.]
MSTLFTSLTAGGAVLALLAAWLVARARQAAPAVVGAQAPQKPGALSTWRQLLTGVLPYLRRLLTTPSAQRYRQPWVILLGQASAGKSSLLASLRWVQQHSDAQAVARPELPGTAWHSLPQGVLIDPEGQLSAAPAGTAQARSWQDLLTALSALRPERALDGVVLVVSAQALQSGDAAQRLRLAQDARRQLQDLRQQLSLLLPVYVVISQCDLIDGFAPYWRVFPNDLRNQLQGCSAPGGVQQAVATEWLDQAWADLVERHKTLQVEAAAVQAQIGEADAFFLYPRHLEALRVHASAYLAEVFQDSSWDQSFLCRGVFFTGNVQPSAAPPQGVRGDIAFVDDLFQAKVLAERGLARIARQSIWSRDQTLRRLQQAGLLAAGLLTLALGAGAWRLDQQVGTLTQAITQIRQTQAAVVASEACIGKAELDQALGQAAAMDTHLLYLSLPLSWFDWRAHQRAVQAVADSVLARSVFPALACALQQRAATLHSALPQPSQATLAGIAVQGSDYARLLATIRVQALAVQSLELNLRRFDTLLAVPSASPDSKLEALNQLSQYLYHAPLPSTALQGRGLVREALQQVPYSAAVPLPARMRASFAEQLQALSLQLQQALLQEVAMGPTLLARLEAHNPPVADNSRWFTSWLSWVSQSWLPSDPANNPCTQDARELERLLRPLVQAYQYPTTLLSALPRYGEAKCYQPAMAVLRGMQMAPYGALAVTQGKGATLVLNPELGAEVRGFAALLSQSFMQVRQPLAFSCLKSAPAWRTVDVGKAESYAREFQQFSTTQALAPLGTPSARQPLFVRVASDQLEQVMNDALRAAQASAGAPPVLLGLDAVSAADQQLLEQSNAFGQALQPLLATLRLYRQLGFAKSGAVVSQCTRDFASDALARVSSLVDQSRLYQPEAGPADGALVSLGSTPVLRDYLGRQMARAQVLTGYANPFTALLRNTDGINDAQRDNTQSLPYWTNSINQLNSYVQFKEPAGQVGALDSLFLKTVADLSYANCAKQLAAYTPPDYGNDLFSSRRKSLLQWLGALCTNRQATTSADAYNRLAKRFGTELAGRYPFGTLDNASEASLGSTKAFFLDYDLQRASLEQSLSGVDRSQWKSQLDFINQLDQVAAFLRGSLSATPASQPLRLAVSFRAQPTPSAGGASNAAALGNQVVSWSLSAGARVINYPSLSAPTLDWPFGQALELNLNWAERSVWRPVATSSSTASGLVIDGASAGFSSGGNWALLRLLERFQPKLVPASDPNDPNRRLLELVVPVIRTDSTPVSSAPSQAVLYLGLNLSANDSKGPTPVSVNWPGAFPRTAPAAPANPIPATTSR